MNEEQTYRQGVQAALTDLKSDMKEGFAGVFKRQDKTNGHVAEAQRDIASLKLWRAYITGGLSVVTLIMVPILLYIVTKGL